MISLRTDTVGLRALSLLDITTRDAPDVLRRLGSGDRLFRSAADAAGSSVATELGAKAHSLRMATANSDHGLSLVQVAEGGLREIGQNLIRMRELAVASASDTLGATERGYLDQEFVARAEEITRTADTTEWSGISLLNTAGLTYDVQVGIDGTANSRVVVTLDDVRASAGNMAVDAGSTDVLTAASARTAIGDLDRALDFVNGLRSGLGATQNRILSAYRLAEGMRLDTLEAESRIRDTDVMADSAQLARYELTKNTAMAFVLQARKMSRSALALIR